MMERNVPKSNCKFRLYPTGDVEAICFNYQAYGNYKKVTPAVGMPVLPKGQKRSGERAKKSRSDSILRSKNKVFDIAIMNEWDYFFTLTLDQTKIERYDPEPILKAFKNWLRSMSARSDMKYLFVPEFHEDGAIHFHGLVRGNFKMVDGGKRTKDGRIIYNVKNWKYGFSTAIELQGPRIAVAKYITKYISKHMVGVLKNFYYAGGGIVRDVPEEYANVCFEKLPVDEHGIGIINSMGEELAVKYVKFDKNTFSAFDVASWQL